LTYIFFWVHLCFYNSLKFILQSTVCSKNVMQLLSKFNIPTCRLFNSFYSFVFESSCHSLFDFCLDFIDRICIFWIGITNIWGTCLYMIILNKSWSYMYFMYTWSQEWLP
jgi:hypothetical protein